MMFDAQQAVNECGLANVLSNLSDYAILEAEEYKQFGHDDSKEFSRLYTEISYLLHRAYVKSTRLNIFS